MPVQEIFALPVAALALSLAPAAAQAQDNAPDDIQVDAQDDEGKRDYYVLLGAGPRVISSYPGSDDLDIGPFPEIAVWEAGTAFPIESPDEGLGPVIVGKRLGTGVGATFVLAPTRSSDDIPGLDKVGFGIEAGGFAQTFLTPGLRARVELRRGIGSHNGLVADGMVDAVVRGANERFVLTAGPRVRWGDGRFHRELFGIDAGESVASGLAAFRPGAGIYALGGATGAHYFFSPSLGAYAYGRYDRLLGDAADSPIVRHGSRDQFETGIALTYRFRLRR